MRLLLHTCCAPCSTWSIEILRKEYDITCFFYNPNIQPREEYDARVAEARRFSSIAGVGLIEGEYSVEEWESRVKGHEDDPEGGQRCRICYRLRLEETSWRAGDEGFDVFSTTLTISPHKDSGVINDIGEKVGRAIGVPFLPLDLKKGDGFRKSVEMSRQHNLYRQDYCGCVYSRLQRVVDSSLSEKV
ncbi:MAG: epoxyqueuosine reductase QueH [Thermoplasmata archaeon]